MRAIQLVDESCQRGINKTHRLGLPNDAVVTTKQHVRIWTGTFQVHTCRTGGFRTTVQLHNVVYVCIYIYRGGNTIQPNEVSSHVPTSFEEIGSQTQLDKIPSFLTVIGS